MYLQFNKSKGKNGKEYETVLLCEKYRDKDTKVPKTRVIANLTKLGFSNEIISNFKIAINKTKGVLVDSESIKIKKTIDYGYLNIILTLMDRLKINQTIEKAYPGRWDIVKLMIIGKIITRKSKLCIFNWIKRENHIAEKINIDIDNLKVDDLYSELGELSRLQPKVEKKWNLYHKKRHQNIFLYDITSSYFEGVKNVLSAFGYNRDGKKGKKQITIGLITDNDGFPLKIEVFKGNTLDYKTVNEQLKTIKEEFQAESIILVGDRGMRIRLNLNELTKDEAQNISYISALASSEIRTLINKEVIQLELFADELVEIEEAGVRYILRNNPILKAEKTKTRDALKARFEENIISIKNKWQNRRNKNLENIEKISKGSKNKRLVTCFSEKNLDNYKYTVEKKLQKYRMRKFYNITITNEEFIIDYDINKYHEDKSLDGKYIIETTVSKDQMSTQQVHEKYKNLQNVEHAFRDLKTDKLNIRPIYHIKEAQTRGHVFICMFSYAIIKELESKIYPWLNQYNAKYKTKLSYYDIVSELNNIKVSELELGYKLKKVLIPELTQIQTEIMKLFNLKIEDMTKL